MYHQVAVPAPRGTQFRGLTVHPTSFRRQMTWMKRLGYRGLSMRDLTPYLRGECEGKVFGITFDDGFRNVFENALPVLSDLGFTSTNYFVANQFDGGNVWDREKNIPFSPLMSLTEVRTWAAAGQEVGSHTLDHVHLPEVAPDEARRQIRLSREILAQESGTEVTAFCYPYGDFTAEHGLLAKEAGYTNATTTSRGLANAADDPFFLPRVGIWRTTHMLRFLQKCLTRHEDRRRA
ncbi:polysaccharide deacetylase family protein [Alcaligenaceae bacterium LF4-65]|uniref:Polysaccharide deacetylase family protein n=2 Tax=Zwartia hollandica TaxID=324606 RepID=A0A953N835_9BURK|nr:polysaccharide deacetylase family protein [Zwartia hollandica]